MGIFRGPNIVRSGLVLALDAADKNSYRGTGTTWTDLTTSVANFTLGCTGTSCTNPTFGNNAIKTSFTATTDNYADCSNVSTTLKNLLYGDHTIEVDCKINSLTKGIDLNAAYTTETRNALIIWTGYHSGLTIDNTNLYYEIWNSTSNPVGISASNIASYVGKNIIIQTVRISNTLYIYFNGVLVSSGAITAPTNYGYNNLRIGVTGTSLTVSNNSYAWPSNIDFYSVKLYNIGFNQSQVTQNYNAIKTRFGLGV